jgi:hypothetical protein
MYRTRENQMYVRHQKAAEVQQRFDKMEMLSFLPPEITAAAPPSCRAVFKLYHYRIAMRTAHYVSQRGAAANNMDTRERGPTREDIVVLVKLRPQSKRSPYYADLRETSEFHSGSGPILRIHRGQIIPTAKHIGTNTHTSHPLVC